MQIFNEQLEQYCIFPDDYTNEQNSLLKKLKTRILISLVALFVPFFLGSFLGILIWIFTTTIYILHLLKNQVHNINHPIVVKLSQIGKEREIYDLIFLWGCFCLNTKQSEMNKKSSNVIILHNKEMSDIELFQKLDNDLMYFINHSDENTLMLLNLDDFELYKQLYMKHVAPSHIEHLLYRIQSKIEQLSKNILESDLADNYLIKQLNLFKEEVQSKKIDINDYFAFNKWYQNTLDMLKLDKDSDIVKNNYQHMIHNIHNNFNQY